MADTLTTRLKCVLEWNLTDALDLSTVKDQGSVTYDKETADGVAVDTADQVWHDTRTLNTNTSETLNLKALTSTIFGATVTKDMVKVKQIVIVNKSTTSGDDLIIGGASDAFIGPVVDATDKLTVGADSVLIVSSKKDGWATNSTVKNLKIENPVGNGNITFDIAITGTSS